MPSSNFTLFATASSNSITITLPTAVGITGVTYKIIRTDTTFTNPITINTTSSQTIGGSGTSRKMYTANEIWQFVSDGSNWMIINHSAKTPAVSYGSIVYSSTGSVPTMPTATYHDLIWRRDGKFLYVNYGISPSNNPTLGTGTYLFPLLPTALSGLTVDTSINPVYTGGSSGSTIWTTGSSHILLGVSAHSTTTLDLYGTAIVYSSYYIRIFQIMGTTGTNTSGIANSTYHPLNATNTARFTISCMIPITEFDS
jgi:hypothetical protein